MAVFHITGRGIMPDTPVPVVILGAGGYAQVVYELLEGIEGIQVIGHTDRAMGLSERASGEGLGSTILGDDDALPDLAEAHPGLHTVLGIGPEMMDVRARLIARLERLAIPALSVVHSSASLSSSAAIEGGTLVRAGAIVGSQVTIGPHCTLGLGASVDHHTHIGRNVFIGQGAALSSYVTLGDHVVVEMGATVNKRVAVGEGVRIAAGAFVNTDVPERAVVMGIPARVVRYQESP
jgi:sugar O-acyltransferase (sialic acid O-acetyltransferase NeuD family)